MHIEYSHHDHVSKDIELLNIISKVAKLNIGTISVLPQYIKNIKSNIDKNIKIASPIDFPMGILDSTSRVASAEYCIKNNVDILDVVCPSFFLCHRKYDKFREDIRLLQTLCSKNNVELRYILEYRQFTYELLYKIAQILLDFNIKTILPSTGYFLDDISDNILASALINKRVPDINIICTGNLWNETQVKMAKNSKIYGLRVNSLNALNLINLEHYPEKK